MKLYYFLPIPNYHQSNRIDSSKIVCAEVNKKTAKIIETKYEAALGNQWKVFGLTVAEVRDHRGFTQWACYKDESFTPNEFKELRAIAPIPKES